MSPASILVQTAAAQRRLIAAHRRLTTEVRPCPAIEALPRPAPEPQAAALAAVAEEPAAVAAAVAADIAASLQAISLVVSRAAWASPGRAPFYLASS
jgi:hypothetical protein